MFVRVRAKLLMQMRNFASANHRPLAGPPEECSPSDLGWNNCGVMKSSSKLVRAKSLVVVVQASRLVAVNLSQSTCLFRIQCSKQLVMPQGTQLAM